MLRKISLFILIIHFITLSSQSFACQDKICKNNRYSRLGVILLFVQNIIGLTQAENSISVLINNNDLSKIEEQSFKLEEEMDLSSFYNPELSEYASSSFVPNKFLDFIKSNGTDFIQSLEKETIQVEMLPEISYQLDDSDTNSSDSDSETDALEKTDKKEKS